MVPPGVMFHARPCPIVTRSNAEAFTRSVGLSRPAVASKIFWVFTAHSFVPNPSSPARGGSKAVGFGAVLFPHIVTRMVLILTVHRRRLPRSQYLLECVSRRIHALYVANQSSVLSATGCSGAQVVGGLSTSYDDLSLELKEENLAAARSVLDLLQQFPDSPLDVLARRVHESWLVRNHLTADSPQLVSFDQLPMQEKDKDRAVVLAARAVLKEFEDRPGKFCSKSVE